MKKNFKTLLAGILAVACIAIFASCGGATKLKTPAGFSITGDTASWTAVTNASGYTVKASTANAADITKDTANGPQFDLTALNLTSGKTYQISVKATSNVKDYADSDYSATVDYTVQVPNGTYNATAISMNGVNIDFSSSDAFTNSLIEIFKAIYINEYGDSYSDLTFENLGETFTIDDFNSFFDQIDIEEFDNFNDAVNYIKETYGDIVTFIDAYISVGAKAQVDYLISVMENLSANAFLDLQNYITFIKIENNNTLIFNTGEAEPATASSEFAFSNGIISLDNTAALMAGLNFDSLSDITYKNNIITITGNSGDMTIVAIAYTLSTAA